MLDSPTHQYLMSRVRPPDLSDIDWGAAPLRFKLYRHCEQIPLFPENPVPENPGSALQHRVNHLADLERLGQMLYEIYGITRQEVGIHITAPHPRPSDQLARVDPTGAPAFGALPLRSVPSGGALFPCELYAVFGAGVCVAPGVYHYDAAHHALDVLRTGDYSSYLAGCLTSMVTTPPMCVLLLTCVFWKNGFKYGAFSYRLQALDAGCIIGQTRVVAEQFAFRAVTHYQFLDEDINQLLGVESRYESALAAISLLPTSTTMDAPERIEGPSASEAQPSGQASGTVEPLYTRFSLGSIASWPMCEALHRASLIGRRDAFRQPGDLPAILPPAPEPSQCLQVDAGVVPADELFRSRRARRSAAGQFEKTSLTQDQLALLLATSTVGHESDVDGRPSLLQHTQVYCVVNAAQHTSPGVYRYHPQDRTLESVPAADQQQALGAALLATHNVFAANLCIFLVGNYGVGFEAYGDRWYRMQNIEAGTVVQRLYLTAASLRLSCRASLGFDGPRLNQALCLPSSFSVLIQVVIAGERPPYQLYEQRIPNFYSFYS